VRELAHEAGLQGVLVLYGASDAVVNTPYQPFVESLDYLVRQTDSDALVADLGISGGELVRLLPDLATRAGVSAPSAAADPDTERHRLHTAVSDLLAAVSLRVPVLLVLEDVHWADPPSLHLFRQLSRTSADSRLLLLATFREREPEVRSEFSEALADLSRIEGVERLRLSGLSREDVAEFVRRSAGTERGELEAVARAICELTEGNPFLLCELWRSIVESGAVEIAGGYLQLTRPLSEVASPESVKDVVDNRLGRLADSTTTLLEVAAVIGSEFELGVVGRASGLDDEVLSDALEEAVQSGTIEDVSGATFVYRFTHELVRRALYDRLTGIRRAELHLRVGEALERSHQANTAPVLPELAHHFAIAAPIGGRDRGVTYNIHAAEAARSSLAFEDAVVRLSTALELGIDDERLRAQVELDLGDSNDKAGNTQPALAAFRSAASLARERADAEMFARAAIGFEEACWAPGITAGTVELLREATTLLDETDSALRAHALSALGRALVFVGQHDEAKRVRSEAIAMARRLGAPRTLAAVLCHAYWARATEPLEDVLAMLTEARELGAELDDAEILAEASAWRIVTLVGLCQLEEARREREALLQIAEQSRQPIWLHIAEQFGSALALCDGRLDEAEALAQRSWEWNPHLRGRDPSGVYGMQLFGVRREQGRLAELKPVLGLLGDRGHTAWRPGLIVLLTELGEDEEARAELRRMRAGGFATVPRDSLWLASVAYLTDACSDLDDEESAGLLYPELERLAGANVQVAQLVACYGAADRYLGMLATVLRRWDDAEAHFEYALFLNRRMRAHAWTAHTLYQYGRMLLRRNARGDRERAAEQLEEAAQLAAPRGLVRLLERLRVLSPVAAQPDVYPDGLSAREVEVLRHVAVGRSNREIGAALHISEHTAANHIRSILRKTSCANRTEAASYAHRHGLASA
jgi:DNA-binding CsgD family transcriptional regulator